MNKKIKVLTICDHPLSPSGVGTQTKYVIESLLKTGRYEVLSFGGAISHENYDMSKVEPYMDDWRILPVDNYGTQEHIRSALRAERPDVIWFMTDPRFWGWLWEIEDEIRANVPLVYYHVWDNYPAPEFNKIFYQSNDVIATISKVTDDIVSIVAPDVERHYIPHAIDPEFFHPLEKEDIAPFIVDLFGVESADEIEDRFTFFWNNRNARRKQSGTLLYWFNEFLDRVGRDKARLIMHTDPSDAHGQPLVHLCQKFGLTNKEVMLSIDKLPPQYLNKLYNLADCTLNISDAEGFGLATLESLSTGTPIIVTMTGGLQEQVTDGEEWFGIGIEPASKALIGSQQVPYIFEDRINKEEFIDALTKMMNMSDADIKKLGKKGLAHVRKNYNFEDFSKKWVEVMDSIYENHGSWKDRKLYNNWTLEEIT